MSGFFDVNHILSVERFGQKQLNRLRKNDHKDEIGWKDLRSEALRYNIRANIRKMENYLKEIERDSVIDFKEMAIVEAVDAANYLMMLVENLEDE